MMGAFTSQTNQLSIGYTELCSGNINSIDPERYKRDQDSFDALAFLYLS
jgi:hypothetical protein